MKKLLINEAPLDEQNC